MYSSEPENEGVPLNKALADAKANTTGRVLGRDADNRIEPECWPVVKPGFEFTKDQKFFTIGSCFAGNIARRLEADGYNVHKTGGQRTRYTPAAIFQEIAWAGEIRRRDGIVRREDVEPLLIESGPDRFSDLWSRPGKDSPVDMAAAIERRQSLYKYFSGAYDADVVVMTLGLIEAWYDIVSKTYVELDGAWIRRRDRDRFRFQVLSFDECKSFVRRTLDLLMDGERRVLITTSPVVLARTFTDKDIIVANNHSKSVLRAVAGELSDEIEGVDYFPSYEIATISGRQQVWEDDLRHVQPNFVSRIMQHVTNAYVPGSVTDDTSELMRMANLVDAGEFESANPIYDRLPQAAEDSTDPTVHSAVVRLAMNRGDEATAVRFALRFDADDDRLYFSHPEWVLQAARALCLSDDQSQQGEVMLERMKRLCAVRPAILQPFLINRERARDEDGVRFVLDLIESTDVDHPALVNRAISKLQEMGESKRALALARRQLGKTPENGLILGRYARLLMREDRSADAIESLQKITELEPDSGWAQFALARSLYQESRCEDALKPIAEVLKRQPDDGQALALRARSLMRLGRTSEAKESALAAQAASNGDARILRRIQPVLDA